LLRFGWLRRVIIIAAIIRYGWEYLRFMAVRVTALLNLDNSSGQQLGRVPQILSFRLGAPIVRVFSAELSYD